MPVSTADESRPARLRAWWVAVAFGLGAALPCFYLFGYTVDDALVTARVAHHLATGHGYRFNPEGPVVDAVTPLGWVLLLVPFARQGSLPALLAAKWLGVSCWVMAAAWLGWRVGLLTRNKQVWFLVPALAFNAPLGAWAASGMETGMVTALATLGLGTSPLSLVSLGLAAGWRPELAPWAITLATLTAWTTRGSAGSGLAAGLLVTLPSVVVALIRIWCFGSAAPLALLAKPSDVEHGAYYVASTLVHAGFPLLVLAPWAWRRLGWHERSVLLAFVVHLLCLILVGGDWMALFRLAVPVLPGLILVGAAVFEMGAPWANLLRTVAALTVSARLMLVQGPRARAVGEERSSLIEAVTPVLSSARRVAALDVGWVGASTPGEVVDLAGITDPSVAVLPGGHTSKRIPPDFLARRRVDHLVVLLVRGVPEAGTEATRVFRARVEREAFRQACQLGCDRVASVPLGQTGEYLVLRVRAPVDGGSPE